MVALILLSILVAAAARGLMTSMRSDETSVLLFEGGLILNRIEAASIRHTPSNETAALTAPGWHLQQEMTPSETSNERPWRVSVLTAVQRPSLRITSAMRAD